MNVRVVISGRNYHAAERLPRQLTLPDGASVDAALQALESLLPGGTRLPVSCLIAVSGLHLGTLRNHRSQLLRDGDELLVLSPVAGG